MSIMTDRRRTLLRGSATHGPSARRDETRPDGLTPVALLITAVALGLAGGMLELTVMLTQRWLSGMVTLESLRTNRHYLWMIPTSVAGLVSLLAIVLAPTLVIARRRMTRPALVLVCIAATVAPLMAVRSVHPAACVVAAAGLGACLAAWLARRAGKLRLWAERSLGFLLVALGVLIGLDDYGVASGERRALAALPTAAPEAPNVLLIVLDTVRADHLSLYGYHRDTSPNLARLAAKGVRFAHARSTAPWTLPSHASLFTGRWPYELSAGYNQALDRTFPTLAEFLADHGYATAGFVANTTYCNAGFGLDRGFTRYEDKAENTVVSLREVLRCSTLGRRLLQLAAWLGIAAPPDNGSHKDAARINGDFLRWVSGRNEKAPFFAFLNFVDAHDPYIVPASFGKRFGLTPSTPADFAVLHEWYRSSKWRMPQREIDLARDAYDDCIAYLDDQLGRLFAALEQRGLMENTLVIVTADHGESWGEHQLFGHWRSIYQPEVHVPLLIAGGARVPSGRTIEKPVSLRDIPATIVELLGLSTASPFPGRPLSVTWSEDAESASPVLSEITHEPSGPGRVLAEQGPTRSLVSEGKLYIQNPFGREELYDLRNDPGESHNLAALKHARPMLLRLRTTLERVLDDSARPGSGKKP